MGYQTVNPFNNEVVASFEDLTDEQAMELLGQAQQTFESWSQTSFPERTAVIKRSAEILRERSDEFARLLTLEMGKLYTEALGEVELSAQILDYYAEKSEGFLAPESLETASADDTAMLVSAPLGVILGVQPWNFDPTKWIIWTLSKLRLTRNLRRVPAEKIRLAQHLNMGATSSGNVEDGMEQASGSNLSASQLQGGS